MDSNTMAQPPEELVIELRDALSHLYNRPYLMRHPLVRYVRDRTASDSLSLADELKQLLTDAIEGLRPDPHSPEFDPAWRPYAVLHSRFVLGRSIVEIESQLSLGTRQVQREQRRGLEMIALALSKDEPPRAASAGQQGNALVQELRRLTDERHAVDVRAVLSRTLELVRPLVSEYRIDVADPDVPADTLVLGNENVFRQLLVAAVAHMAKYVPGGWLRTKARQEGDHVVLHLTAGVPNPLRIPDLNMELPVRMSALAEALKAVVEQSMRSGTVSLVLTLVAPVRDKVVALVEDNEAVIALFSRYVREQGYRLIGIADSTGALNELRQLMPDIVVLDLMMRGTDGWDVLRQLKSDPQLESIPVVVCSVLAEPELARLLGAEAYLVKPVRPEDLRRCLDRLVGPGRSVGGKPR